MRITDGCPYLWRQASLYARVAAYLVAALVAAAPVAYHILHHSTAYLGLLEDDHFYYAAVADNLVTLGKLSYDGSTLTNGFHPLWLAVMTLLRWLCGGLGPEFYLALAALSCLSMVASYELGRRFAMTLGTSPRLAAAIAAIYSLGMARLFSTGMECVLAVPFFTWWLLEIAQDRALTPRRAAWLGLIASLAVLARLDIAIAILISIVGYVFLRRPALRTLLRQLLAFAAGGVLVPIYLLANLVFFGVPLPVSALAKRLITAHGISIAYARAVAFTSYYGPTIAIVLPLGALALYQLIRRHPRELATARFAAAVTLLFAFAFFLVNAESGWIFFGWYAYPLAPATIVALVCIAQRWGPLLTGAVARQAGQLAVLVLVTLAPAGAVRYYVEHGPNWSIRDNTLLAMSYDLAQHLKKREGVFGMGACAGVAAFVSDKTVVQLEGIITDRNLLQHVKNQDPLQDVLREYHVDYLIVSLVGVPPKLQNRCYLVTQPDAQWAGSRTAKMRGAICAEPVEHFFTEPAGNPWSVFPRVETFVWDVRNAHWAAPAANDSGAGMLALDRSAQ